MEGRRCDVASLWQVLRVSRRTLWMRWFGGYERVPNSQEGVAPVLRNKGSWREWELNVKSRERVFLVLVLRPACYGAWKARG